MSLLSHPAEEVVLASPLEGRITLHDKPASGAKVIRKLSWNEGEVIQETTTVDSQGMFTFPINKAVVEIGKFSQFVVSQEISVIFNGEEIDIWIMGKRSKLAYGELNGVPYNFHCELSRQDQPMRLDSGLLLTKCTWEGVKKYQEE